VDVRDDIYKVCSLRDRPLCIPILIYQIPLGSWPKDPQLKELGKYQLEQICASVEPFVLALLTRFLGWSNDECQVLMAGTRRDLRNKQNHLYYNIHFVYGRKPG